MKRAALTLVALSLVLASLAAIALRWSLDEIRRPCGPTDETIVDILPGTSAGAALERLGSEDILCRPWLARLYLIHVLGDPPIQKGEYLFQEPLALPQVLDRLIQGRVLLHSVTLREGLTLWETAAHLADQGFGHEAAFVQAMEDPALVAELDPLAHNLEGYLYPDTYGFPRGVSEKAVVAKLVDTFRKRLAHIPWQDSGFTIRELVTLASIVEKEAQMDEERPVIASVYRNRLDRGMGLYADPTIIYALKLEGRWDGDIRRRDLDMDSPYNTYRQLGLPPGPISSPGIRSLAAAAAPADSPYLYFVSRNDGTHVFAETLSEHNRNVYRWQKLYWQEEREKSRMTQD
jgi:UPF0755 protein